MGVVFKLCFLRRQKTVGSSLLVNFSLFASQGLESILKDFFKVKVELTDI